MSDSAKLPSATQMLAASGLYRGMEGAKEAAPITTRSEARIAGMYQGEEFAGARRTASELRSAGADPASRVDEWARASREDAEIGGAHLEGSIAAAREVAERFGTPALLEALDESGLGSHPEVLRLLARVGRELGGRRR